VSVQVRGGGSGVEEQMTIQKFHVAICPFLGTLTCCVHHMANEAEERNDPNISMSQHGTRLCHAVPEKDSPAKLDVPTGISCRKIIQTAL
jgi:hypothetical protein